MTYSVPGIYNDMRWDFGIKLQLLKVQWTFSEGSKKVIANPMLL